MHTEPYIGLYNKLKNIFSINGNSFQRKYEVIATSFILSIMFVIETVFVLEQITDYRFSTK